MLVPVMTGRPLLHPARLLLLSQTAECGHPSRVGSTFHRFWRLGRSDLVLSRFGILGSTILLCGILRAALSFGQVGSPPPLHAKTYNSHFPAAAGIGESYNGMGFASDGKLYYVIDSAAYNVPGQMYSLDPKTGAITHIADLNTATGQGDAKAVAQGKSHVNFIERDGKLYFSTHLGYYNRESGVERNAVPPNGYLPYPGGHFLSYDLHTGRFESLAIAPRGEGIISFNMDVKRGRLYGITWPTGHFLTFDLTTRQLKDFGGFFAGRRERRSRDHLSGDLPANRSRPSRWVGIFHNRRGRDSPVSLRRRQSRNHSGR